MRRVVVTGVGAIGPNGSSIKEIWPAIIEGRSGIGPISLFEASGFPTRIAGEVKNFNPLTYFSSKELKKMDRFIQFSLIASDEAILSSGLDFNRENTERIGVSIGVGIGGLHEIENQHKILLEKGPRRVTPFFVPMIINNLAAGQISIKYGLKGPNLCTTTACSSSAHSVGEAFRYIQFGQADIMVAGGAEAAITGLSFAGFCSAKALSERNDEPKKASRPFDRDRDGFVISEGAATVILEELEHAKKRGAAILAEITGYGLNCDAYHITAPHPEGDGAYRCMGLAIDDAHVNKNDIDYINAHGTSTLLGDIVETIAIKRLFGDYSHKIMVSSTKSMTGHLLGAAGAIEAIFCVKAIEENIAPPTINLENPDPKCDLNYVPNEPQKRTIKVAMTNSFGFGGTNVCLIFKKYEGN